MVGRKTEGSVFKYLRVADDLWSDAMGQTSPSDACNFGLRNMLRLSEFSECDDGAPGRVAFGAHMHDRLSHCVILSSAHDHGMP